MPGKAVQTDPPREVPALAGRVLIVGLDGATFDVLGPLMDAGRMPHLKHLIDTGTSGILDSTRPPITPAAWTTFMTGKGPGRHGIVDFERYDLDANQLTFNSTFEIREKTIWEILSEKHFRVGSIMVPMTYPPRRVNGFVISGFETPSTDTDFTFPRDLKDDILRRWPDYSYRSDWQRKAFGGNALFDRNMRHIERSFEQGYELTEYCGDRYGWDVLMVLFKLVDNLQHKAWRYLDPRTAGKYPERAERSAQCHTALDATLKKLSAYAERHNATLLIMSDHGHGSLDGKAQPNRLLQDWGYLSLRSRLTQSRNRASQIWRRVLGKKNNRFAEGSAFDRELAVDWAHTRACVMHAGMYGFLYLNVAGRQPDGVVPQHEYEALRDEIRARLLAVTTRDRSGREVQIFPEVHKPEELYRCSRDEQPWMPDLLLVPQPGVAVVRKIRGGRPVRWCSTRRMEGTHRVEGILVAHGPHVRRGHRVRGNLADIAPTILAASGLRVPIDMEGRILSELFDTPPSIEFEPPRAAEQAKREQEVYTEQEKEVLTKRLSDLGYLE
ncbi:MAG: alkaline phosphatase family protein [Phycisphaerae bacterium]|nr:alkaline phosphatase family protein [Phycisphaerae bacterium]